MKRQILFIGLVLGGLTFTSCDKDWTCECVAYDSDGDEIARNSYKIEDADADEAKAECESDSGGLGGVNTECNVEVF